MSHHFVNTFMPGLVLLAMIWSCSPEAGTAAEQENSGDHAWLEEILADNPFEGTLLIASGDSVMLDTAIGLANRTWNIAAKPDYSYDIASLNKAFIAGVILLLVEDGSLALDQELAEFFPIFSGRYAAPVTVHQLLTNTSGIPDYGAVSEDLRKNNFDALKRTAFTTDEYVAFISALDPLFEPGARFYYSNFGYHLLALIAEEVAGQSFAELLDNRICRPLGLNNTFSPDHFTTVYPNMAEAYNYEADRDVYSRNQYIDYSIGRRIYASTPDLHKWALALCRPGKLFSAASLELMKTNHVRGMTGNPTYGYGWYVFDGGDYGRGNLRIDRQYIIHGGSTDGFQAMLTIVEDGELIVAHLSNIGSRTNVFKLTHSIIHHYLNRSP